MYSAQKRRSPAEKRSHAVLTLHVDRGVSKGTASSRVGSKLTLVDLVSESPCRRRRRRHSRAARS